MKTFFTLVTACLMVSYLNAQTTADFENFNLPAESFLNGSDGSGGFSSGNLFLPNSYFDNYMSWSGWAISNTTDVTTPGFTNQYSAISGSGYNGSAAYALTFIFGESIIRTTGAGAGGGVEGLYVNNNTYAYLSMLNGDNYAKRFGGATGDDPDFLLLTIKKYLNGQLSTDSVNFYMADYRFADNSQDYIVKDWTYIDLTSLGDVDSLSFSMTGSDVGQNGLNTPSYICIDNVRTTDMTTSVGGALEQLDVKLAPNPSSDVLSFDWLKSEQGQLEVFDLRGQRMIVQQLQNGKNKVVVANWPTGSYVLRIQTTDEWGSMVFVVQR